MKNLLKYIPAVLAVAGLSKDRRTKVGAIALGPDRESKGFGYNGIPRGCDDDVDARHEYPAKGFWFEHAERNLIYNAARQVLKGSTLITTKFPCADCARGIVQTGFAAVLTVRPDTNGTWPESQAAALEMLQEAGVRVDYYEANDGTTD